MKYTNKLKKAIRECKQNKITVYELGERLWEYHFKVDYEHGKKHSNEHWIVESAYTHLDADIYDVLLKYRNEREELKVSDVESILSRFQAMERLSK